MTPFLSIITICRNEEANIRKTCDSIAQQNYDSFEWIVIDGASTDGTLGILDQYKNVITHLTSEKDSGIYNAMNKGIRQARGQYLLFMNGGDALAEQDTLQKALTTYENLQNLPDILYGESVYADNRNYILNLKNLMIDPVFFSKIVSLHHQATFIKNAAFQKYGLYDESFKIIGDYEWFVRYFTQNPKPDAAYLDQVIALFNTEGISLNPKHRKRTLVEIKRAFETNVLASHQKAYLSLYKNYYWCLYKSYLRQFFAYIGLEKQVMSLWRFLKRQSAS